MTYLFVGKNGAFEAFIIASVMLGDYNYENSRWFADLEAEKRGMSLFVGADEKGNQVFSIGNDDPSMVAKISSELAKAVEHENINLNVIPITVHGDSRTRAYIRLAGLPLIGPLFGGWARTSVIRRKKQIEEKGAKIIEDLSCSRNKLAAKPLMPKT